MTPPASNGKLERLLSEKRTSLNNDALDDLLMVSTMDCPLMEFNADKAIDIWWADKARRPSQKTRKSYTKRSSSSTITSDSESETEEASLLDDWDNWVDSETDD